MTEKRFELIPNLQGQVDIVDHVESEEKNAICIYNDLGVLPFTSAQSLCDLLNELHEENEYYKSIFFELVETALTDKNCRELYCKGILDIFDKANSLNQARDMIKEHLK